MHEGKRWTTIPVALAVTLMAGCATGPDVGRLGLPLQLTTGDPQNRCEIRSWRELVPASAQSIAVNGSTEVTQGVGIFALGDEAPEQLDDVWELMHEPQLRDAHQARIEPVDRALRVSLYWSLTGSAGIVGGIAMGAAAGSNEPIAITALATGFVIGVVGIVGALLSLPSSDDQHDADARRRLLIPAEDDLDAAQRGVTHLNAQVRSSCTSP